MREIKFRMWDSRPNGQCMVDWFAINQTAFNLKTDTPLLWSVFHNPNLILMQYTGLKDKNSKEIYEGDILRIACNFEQRKGEVRDKVCFADGTFYCNDWTMNELIYNYTKGTQDYEVIGNIYEQGEDKRNDID